MNYLQANHRRLPLRSLSAAQSADRRINTSMKDSDPTFLRHPRHPEVSAGLVHACSIKATA
jgi:hypothetical protein